MIEDQSLIKRVTPVYETLELWGLEFLEGAEVIVVPGRAYEFSKEFGVDILQATQNYLQARGIKASAR